MATVLLVEPYFSGSHRSWAEGYQQNSRHDVRLLTLPGRFWKWRMFGGSLTLARQAASLVDEIGQPDVVLASDMLDLPSFLGHSASSLGDPRIVLYMHENQLTYPLSPTARDDLVYAYMNWSSMVRADEVWFNSEFHLESVLAAMPRFLRHFPDHRHTRLLTSVEDKSSVVPVGVDLGWIIDVPKPEPPIIVWNQRWEYDKDPVRLFEALYRLDQSGASFHLAICGENFRNTPIEFDQAKERLSDHIIHFGYAERDTYRQLLLEAAVVVSTARHEFFGVAVVEAMAAGATPVFPNDLSYPDLVPAAVHDATLFRTDDQMDQLLAAAVGDSALRDSVRQIVGPAMRRLSWDSLASTYDERIDKPK